MLAMAATRSKKTGESEFAQRLRSTRLQKDLSQAELAEKAGLHFTSVSRYETGGAHPNADALRRLCQALGVSSDYLMDGHSETAPTVHFQDESLLQVFQEVDRLPSEDKSFFKRVMETMLVKYKVQSITR